MGMKIENTYYSDREIRTVLTRKQYIFPYLQSPLCILPWKYQELPVEGHENKFEDMYKVFQKIVNKRLNQSKQEFLDSL